ncbi:uncharacterized protein LOC127094613 [Lathyrus oleraceus]|uniref:uncharacterized protein LOC127094613 n=1 Tax=Pisum sativum TaxID=3888 RepID=UPI0021D1B198|nr:uncharacterized protein LOC127094613 [Pisum sativum]
MAGEQHSDHSRPLVNYNMDDGPPSHEADVRDGHPSTPSPEPQNNGDVPHAHNLGAETFHPIPVPVEGDAVMIAMVNALNQAGSMLHQQHERIMALEAERQEARPQPVSRIQQRPEPTKKRGRRSPEPHASRARAHRDGGRARTSPRRGHSPDNNELSPLRSDEEDLHCPLSRAIMEAPLPKGMEKPPNLAVYDGTTDPDDHVDNVNAMLDYRNDITGHLKCRLFSTTLRKGAMAWYKSLAPESITSWRVMRSMFTRHFTASRRHPKTEATLEAIVQKKNETLRSYIERFNQEAVEVDTTEHMKKYLLERGLLPGSELSRAVGIEPPRTLNELLHKAQAYIRYEEKQVAHNARSGRNAGETEHSKREDTSISRRNGDRRREERPRELREGRGPAGRYSEYTLLTAPRERILAECINSEFKQGRVRFPKPSAPKPHTDKSKAPEAVHEEERSSQTRRAREEETPENTPPDNSPYQVALCVSRPEDFFPPEPLPEGKITALSPWEDFPTTLVISGGGTNGESAALSVKRKFDELLLTAPEQKATLTKYRGKSNPISFFLEELPGGSPNSAIPLLIRAKMARFDVRRILVDEGSSVDIMYVHLFKTLKLDKTNLAPYVGSDLQGFNGATTRPWGYVELLVTFGEQETAREVKIQFLVVDCPSLYNCIFGRPTLAELTAVPSTVHLKMKYYTKLGRVVTIHGDIEAARRCYDAAVKGQAVVSTKSNCNNKKLKTEDPVRGVNAIDLDCRIGLDETGEGRFPKERSLEHPVRPIPDGEFELIPLGDDPERTVKIGKGLPEETREELVACLKENSDLFAWNAAEMPGLDPEIACHKLAVDRAAKPIAQRRRKQSPEKAEAAERAVKDLLEANFISEAQYTTWLSNVVLVKKNNGKWRMCVDYTDLNRACPKDAFPLPNIDSLVDNSAGFKLLSFMDAYSGYNQIPMSPADKKHTAFMTPTGNYYYNVMPFGLKNAGATYQRMMNKVFKDEIGDMLEVYMDDMIVKSHEEVTHARHLTKVFEQARQCKMRFNPEKCTFGVRAGKFLGFYLTERGIEANPDKCRAFSEFPTPKTKKSIQSLNGVLASLSRFIAKSAQHALPFFRLLRKEATFDWTDECEQALLHLKKVLSQPPVLSRPSEKETLYLYLSVATEAVSAVLIRETDEGQKPIYFTSKALQGPELRYQQIEKVALALINTARRLRYYFLAHTIKVRTDQPIKQLLGRPDMAGRMLKWSLELSEFDIQYESRKALKAQALADFVAEMTHCPTPAESAHKWTIFVDGASSTSGSGAGIILENEEGILIEVSLALAFPTSNNQAEYEAFLAGLRLADDLGAKEVKISTDSQLVASQVRGEYQTKNDNLLGYLSLVKEKLDRFEKWEVQHIPREHNTRADVLSKLASTRKKGGNKSVIQEILPRPSIDKLPPPLEVNAIGDAHCWMTPIYNYLTRDELPADPKEAAIVKRRACSYVLLEGKLYRRGFSIPLLKCVEEEKVPDILGEIHRGINAQHLGGRSLARKALRAGYYWPTMQNDSKEHVKRYNGTQFTDGGFQDFIASLGTTQHFTSVEHPQTNGQAEAANRVILRGLKRRLGEAKRAWVEELHSVLWAYRTTPHSTTGETPFRLTYGTEAVIPVEIRTPTRRTEEPLDEEMNDETLRAELDLVEEIRSEAALRETTLKQKIALRHDAKVIKREFQVGTLVLRRNQKNPREGKLAANWEGPYRVRDKTSNGAYYLENLQGEQLARPWNAEKLRQYYS